ncbi:MULTISPECIES: GGDEF domain-containing protein [Aminobacter]|uniref:GGDEF domain-containing protein n=1 Tax=Aminobacter TaxID=31988 RepID=UPI0028655723|nr:GGDEF domain-containing protein [Aminobacter aminovorans]MDR7223727.1 hypothetical protein [Aminobacter aminovorans]
MTSTPRTMFPSWFPSTVYHDDTQGVPIRLYQTLIFAYNDACPCEVPISHSPGLPNRALFLDRLNQALARRNRGRGEEFAVLFIDLDRFKVVNDSLGHLAGDRLIIEVAARTCICFLNIRHTSDNYIRLFFILCFHPLTNFLSRRGPL